MIHLTLLILYVIVGHIIKTVIQPTRALQPQVFDARPQDWFFNLQVTRCAAQIRLLIIRWNSNCRYWLSYLIIDTLKSFFFVNTCALNIWVGFMERRHRKPRAKPSGSYPLSSTLYNRLIAWIWKSRVNYHRRSSMTSQWVEPMTVEKLKSWLHHVFFDQWEIIQLDYALTGTVTWTLTPTHMCMCVYGNSRSQLRMHAAWHGCLGTLAPGNFLIIFFSNFFARELS